MNKFGLLDDESGTRAEEQEVTISERIAAFPPVRSRGHVDFAAIDAAAAQHGFVSREISEAHETRSGRRRRTVPSEPTRHLAIRLTETAYDRFVAYADRHKLTYHEALIHLLDHIIDERETQIDTLKR
jgi:hypothetical protein